MVSYYTILIAPQALDSVKAAAEELQDLIQKVGGAKLPIKETPYFSERFIDGGRPHSERGVKKLLKRGILRHNYYQARINDESTRWGRRMLLGNQKSVAMGHAWYSDEHKIYIDPSSKVSKMWIKLSLFGENASIKNIELIKLK